MMKPAMTVLICASLVLADYGTVAHDKLAIIPQNVVAGDWAYEFAPELNIDSGCQIYPAVDDAGLVSGGLHASKGPESGCADPTRGQTYSRIYRETTKTVLTFPHDLGSSGLTNKFAIVYAWYLPKSEPENEKGHRHKWLYVVLWLDGTPEPDILGVWSMEDLFSRTFNRAAGGGRTVFITKGYDGAGPEVTSVQAPQGRKYPVADWDNLSGRARDALNHYPFGGRPCPLSDGMFASVVQASRPPFWT